MSKRKRIAKIIASASISLALGAPCLAQPQQVELKASFPDGSGTVEGSAQEVATPTCRYTVDPFDSTNATQDFAGLLTIHFVKGSCRHPLMPDDPTTVEVWNTPDFVQGGTEWHYSNSQGTPCVNAIFGIITQSHNFIAVNNPNPEVVFTASGVENQLCNTTQKGGR